MIYEAIRSMPMTSAVRGRQASQLTQQLVRLSRSAIADDRHPMAEDFFELAVNSARRAADRDLARSVAEQQDQLKQIHDAYEEIQQALETLEVSPSDPDANLMVGRYHCFYKGAWSWGLPMLSLGSDTELAEVAYHEIQRPATPEEFAELGDSWLAVAERLENLPAIQARARARRWYSMAMPKLSGISQARVQRQLAAIPDETLLTASEATALAQLGIDPEVQHSVALALKWLVDQQGPAGNWTFFIGPNAGDIEAQNAATALALLALLRSGNSHRDGRYKESVLKGLEFLGRRMKVSSVGGDFQESGGRMYSQGMATMALCEAYARTKDKRLRDPAQLAANFIVYAQDPNGGGWRYKPHEKGDTSASGWQITALKVAAEAELQVPPGAFVGANKFLDSVQSEGGTSYGYTGPGNKRNTTAIGLLCRLYTGADRQHPSIAQGINKASTWNPGNDVYYNYYVTQLLHTGQSENWSQWRSKLREYLIERQVKEGPTAGSWYLQSAHSSKGGRHYCTTLSVLALLVGE